MSTPSARPEWLPPEIDLNGSWPEIRDRLYAYFLRDVARRLYFRSCPVWHDRRKLDDDLPEGFWHVTHRDELIMNPTSRRKEKQRIFDPSRSRRLSWLKPIIEHDGDPSVLIWDFVEDDGRESTYVWLRTEYLVVLARRQLRLGTVYTS